MERVKEHGGSDGVGLAEADAVAAAAEKVAIDRNGGDGQNERETLSSSLISYVRFISSNGTFLCCREALGRQSMSTMTSRC